MSGAYSDLTGLPTLGTVAPYNVGNSANNVPVVNSTGFISATIIPTIPATKGGTGQTVFTTGDILSASNTTNLALVSAVATGSVLLSQGTGTLPAYGKVNLASSVITGTLPASNGGTGLATYTIGDILAANSTSTLGIVSAVATGSVLLSQGTGTAPAYGKVNLASTVITGTLPVSNRWNQHQHLHGW